MIDLCNLANLSYMIFIPRIHSFHIRYNVTILMATLGWFSRVNVVNDIKLDRRWASFVQ